MKNFIFLIMLFISKLANSEVILEKNSDIIAKSEKNATLLCMVGAMDCSEIKKMCATNENVRNDICFSSMLFMILQNKILLCGGDSEPNCSIKQNEARESFLSFYSQTRTNPAYANYAMNSCMPLHHQDTGKKNSLINKLYEGLNKVSPGTALSYNWVELYACTKDMYKKILINGINGIN